MLKRLVIHIFMRRHFWRHMSFDDVAELYVSRLMTIFAVNIATIFVALFMYQSGYSVPQILLYYLAIYVFRIPVAWVAAMVAAYLGPKHGILIANIIRIPSLLVLLLLDQWGIMALVWFGGLTAIAATLYDLCYMIDFSKVKHVDHAGREIGTMQIIERIARVVSPLVGGVLATSFGAHVAIMVASVIFLLAAVPLFRTREPTETRMKLKFRELPWHAARRTFLGEVAVGADFIASGLVWMLFIASTMLSTIHEGAYAYIGVLTSIGVVASLVAAWAYGHLIDRERGRELMIVGSVGNWLVHLFRPFVSSTAGATGVGIASEVMTAGYNMAFTRVLFDIADQSSYRIGYLMIIEMMFNVGALLICGIAALSVWAVGVTLGLQLAFVVASFAVLLLIPARSFAARR